MRRRNFLVATPFDPGSVDTAMEEIGGGFGVHTQIFRFDFDALNRA
jgi:hypothetical protein